MKKSIATVDLPEELSIETVKILLAEHSINVNTIFIQNSESGRTKTTLLHSAIKQRNRELIDWLLTEEVDINIGPLHQELPINVAIKQNDLSTVRELISLGANLNPRELKSCDTPLGVAINYRRTMIAEHLIENGADVNLLPHEEYRCDKSLLQSCVEWEDIKMTKFLLSKGANINYKSAKGDTPLTCAARSRNLELVKLLINSGADINHIYKEGDDMLTVLHTAIKSGNVELVDFFCNLDESVFKVGVLTKKKKQPILHFAIQEACLFYDEIIEYLLAAGADVNAEDCDGNLAIHIRPQYGVNQNYILEKHLVKLLSVDLPICQKNYDKIKRRWASFVADCRQEVDTLKNTKIGEVHTTFYDVLHLSNHSLRNRVKCLEIDYNLEDNRKNLCEKFPLYGKMLAFKLAKAQRRMRRCLKAEDEMMKIFMYLGLSYDFCREMFCYLSGSDLKRIIGEKIFS